VIYLIGGFLFWAKCHNNHNKKEDGKIVAAKRKPLKHTLQRLSKTKA
jgi:hypothetical protein